MLDRRSPQATGMTGYRCWLPRDNQASDTTLAHLRSTAVRRVALDGKAGLCRDHGLEAQATETAIDVDVPPERALNATGVHRVRTHSATSTSHRTTVGWRCEGAPQASESAAVEATGVSSVSAGKEAGSKIEVELHSIQPSSRAAASLISSPISLGP